MQKLRAEELWVAACVRAAEPGVIVGQHDDNTSRNVHDLDLSRPGGRTFAALEVTTAADPEVFMTDYQLGDSYLDICVADDDWARLLLELGWADDDGPED